MRRKHFQQDTFLQWLKLVLQDERWCDFIATEIKKHELPIIESEDEPVVGRQTDKS